MKKHTEDQVRIKMLNKSNYGRTELPHHKGKAIELNAEQLESFHLIVDDIRGLQAMDHPEFERVNVVIIDAAKEHFGHDETSDSQWLEFFSKPCYDRLLANDLVEATLDEVFAETNTRRTEVLTISLLRRCCSDLAKSETQF